MSLDDLKHTYQNLKYTLLPKVSENFDKAVSRAILIESDQISSGPTIKEASEVLKKLRIQLTEVKDLIDKKQ